jgi:hypothetical protein
MASIPRGQRRQPLRYVSLGIVDGGIHAVAATNVYMLGIIAAMPSRSRAAVKVGGLFAEGCRKVEFKRARRTGNGNNLQC